MRQVLVLMVLFWIFNCFQVSYSQELSAGSSTGINFSDIHKNDIIGKWKFKPGPTQRIFLNYNFNNYLGLQTGLTYSALYYEKVNYSGPYAPYFTVFSSSSIHPWISSNQEMMNFSFLTVPLQVKLLFPSKPRISFSAGIYYSFLLDYSIFMDNPFYYKSVILPQINKSDLGFAFSTGISYPLNDKFATHFDVSYQSGMKKFMYTGYRHGSVDFALGLSYMVFTKDKKINSQSTRNDSTQKKVSLTYFGGVNISWNGCGYFNEKYSVSEGLSTGLLLNLRLSDDYSLQTGLSFERMGYTFRDSSTSFYRYVPEGGILYNVDTRMRIDYILIPVLSNFYLGKSKRAWFNTGPYGGLRLNAFCTGEAIHELHPLGSYQEIKTTIYDDAGQLIKKNDFGWIFGAGYSIPVYNKLLLDISLQYRAGLIDVYNIKGFPEMTQRTIVESFIRNRAVTFRIGVRLPTLN